MKDTRRIRPHATVRPPKEARPPRPPQPNYYLAKKATGLKYDYGQIPEQHRQQVQRAALEIHRWQRDTIALGQTLLAVKEVLEHGQFEDWWQTEFGLSERMVQSLLTVARVYGDASNPRRVAGLSDSALYLLAAPSTPEAARAEVEAMIVAGQTPTRAEVKRVIVGYKPPKVAKPKQLPAPAIPKWERAMDYDPRSEWGMAAGQDLGSQEPAFVAVVANPPSGEKPTITAEYTVMPSAPPGDLVRLRHELLLKMIDGAAHKIFMPFLSRDEHDELFIALTRALEE